MITKILRWLGIPVLMAGLGAAGFLTARWAVTQADANCADMVGGACVEGWHTDAVEWSIYIGVVLTVLLMTVFCAWLAPAGKRVVAILVGALACVPFVAGYVMTGWADLVFPIGLALAAAIVGIVWIWRTEGVRVT